MGEHEASKDDLNARGLWQIATELVDAKLLPQAIQVLEALSHLQVNSETLVVIYAKILLSETFAIHCKNNYSSDKIKEFSQTTQLLIQNAKECIQSLPDGHLQAHWLLRLMKAEYLAFTMSNQNKITRDRQILNLICNAIRFVKENSQSKNVHEYENYFIKRLCVFFEEANEELLRQSTDYSTQAEAFQQNLNHVRSILPEYIDSFIQLWLVEVCCHVMVMDQSGQDDSRVRQALQMSDNHSQSALVSYSTSTSEISSTLSAGGLRIYHLIITCFYLLRHGEIKQLANPVIELKEMCEKFKTQYPEAKGIWKELYVQNMIDLLELNILSCQDPCEAVVRSTNAIHKVQASLKHYNESSNNGIQLMLTVMLFDFLNFYCQLQVDQGHYIEVSTCLAQASTLMRVHKLRLKKWILYGPVVAQIHITIAKYAIVTGEVTEAIRHLQIAGKMIPPIDQKDIKSYPEWYLSVWISILDVTTYCINGSLLCDSQKSTRYNSLIHFAASIIENSRLRDRMKYCSSHAIRAKYDLSVARWLCATENVSQTNCQENFKQYVSIESQRSNLSLLLQQALKRTNTHMSCKNTVAELMALYGSRLVTLGNIKSGADALQNALKVSTYTRNIRLEILLLAPMYELDAAGSQSHATAAQKYQKKSAIHQESINQALSDRSLHQLVLRI